MAFEMTHLRLAKDLKKVLCVQNEFDYYMGSVYPDSRYVTGVSRTSTHTRNPLTNATSDFDKGKLTHILYDQLVGPKYLELLSESNPEVKGFTDSWIKQTASKLIEDQCSYDALHEDMNSFLELFSSPVLPHEENNQKLTHYYQLLSNLYRQKPTMKDYSVLFRDFRVPENAAQGVIDTAKTFEKDVHHVHSIQKLYDAGLKAGLNEVAMVQNEML